MYPLKMFQPLCKYIAQCSEPHPSNTVDRKRQFTINYQIKHQMTSFFRRWRKSVVLSWQATFLWIWWFMIYPSVEPGSSGNQTLVFALHHLAVANKACNICKICWISLFNWSFRSGVTVALYQVSDEFVLS